MRKKSLRGEQILQHTWVSYIKDETDVTNPIQMEAELSYAMAVMEQKVG